MRSAARFIFGPLAASLLGIACTVVSGAADLHEAPTTASSGGDAATTRTGTSGGTGGTSGGVGTSGTTIGGGDDDDTTADSGSGTDASNPASGITTCNAVGLAAYWRLDDATGTVAKDCSPNANDGTLGIGSWATGRNGQSALALAGNPGPGDGGIAGGQGMSSLSIPASPTLAMTGSMTVTAWMFASEIGSSYIATNILLGRGAGSRTPDWVLWIVEGQLFAAIRDSFGTKMDTTKGYAVTSGNWQHIALVFRPTNSLELWVGGALAQVNYSMPPAALQNDGAVGYGDVAGGTTGYSPADARLQQVRIFNRALSSDEIITLANEP